MDITYHIYLGILTMAALVAIVFLAMRSYSATNIVAILVLYTGLVEWSVFYKREFLPDKTNAQIYNCFMLVQYLAFAYYFQQIITLAWIRRIIQGFMYFFPVFWYVLVFFIFKPDEWNSYVYMVGGVFTIVSVVVYCHQLLIATEPIILRYEGKFWIAIGLLFFYVCSVPYMGMYRFLAEYHNGLAKLLWIPLQISNIVMYSLFTYAFICQLTATKRS